MEKIIDIINELQAIHERNTGQELQRQQVAEKLKVSASAVSQWGIRGTPLLSMKLKDAVTLAFVWCQITTQKTIINKEEAFLDFFRTFLLPQIAREFKLDPGKLGTPSSLTEMPIDGVLQLRISQCNESELLDLLDNLHQRAIALLRNQGDLATEESEEMASLSHVIDVHLDQMSEHEFIEKCDLKPSRFKAIMDGSPPTDEEIEAIAPIVGWGVDRLKELCGIKAK